MGKFCSVEGGECVGNGAASLCLESFDSFSNYCTMIDCKADADCGEGAYCAMQEAGSGCVPNGC